MPIVSGGQAAGGGTTPGAAIVRAFPFAFNTAGILTGAALYTPTVGDLLLDAWIENLVLWNGTTPQADIGTFVGTNFGLFNYWVSDGALPLDTNLAGEYAGTGITAWSGTGLAGLAATASARSLYETAAIAATPVGATLFAFRFASESMQQCQTAIGRFTAANPVKVVVSQTGAVGGANPASTVGSAVLYLVTATPT